jgi:hypothetical protein
MYFTFSTYNPIDLKGNHFWTTTLWSLFVVLYILCLWLCLISHFLLRFYIYMHHHHDDGWSNLFLMRIKRQFNITIKSILESWWGPPMFMAYHMVGTGHIWFKSWSQNVHNEEPKGSYMDQLNTCQCQWTLLLIKLFVLIYFVWWLHNLVFI